MLSHFAEGSAYSGYCFRILQKVPLTSVEAFAFCGRITRIDFKLLQFARAIFNAIFDLKIKVMFYRLFVPDEQAIKPLLIYQKNCRNKNEPENIYDSITLAWVIILNFMAEVRAFPLSTRREGRGKRSALGVSKS